MILGPPVDVELWIILFYVGSLLVGARVVEALARLHFARAQRYSEQGFEYIKAHDVYRCPEGEYLSLHNVHQHKRLAVYRARAASCGRCRLKALCAPSDEGRLVFRSLAAWAETSVGMFHRCISVVMFTVAVVICVVAMRRWGGEAGSAWLAGGLLAGVVLIIQNVGMIFRTIRSD